MTSRSLLGLACAAALMAACGSTVAPCGPGTCDGCCDASGQCLLLNDPASCGVNGAACTSCGAGERCTLGVCTAGSTGGGGGEDAGLGGGSGGGGDVDAGAGGGGATGGGGGGGGGGAATGGGGGATGGGGGGDDAGMGGGSGGGGEVDAGAGGGGGATGGGGGATGGGGGATGGGGGALDGGTGGGAAVADPDLAGPLAITELDATTTVAATGDTVAIHAAVPTSGGPYPVAVLAHGFQLPPSQYYGYVRRLASFGYVALTVDFPTSLTGNDNPKQARDLLGGVDWAAGAPQLAGKVDATRVLMTGHSLGGKLALLAATYDARVKAVFAIDPVDNGGSSTCNPPSCVVVKSLMPSLSIPTGFIGETTDATGSFQACAPAADNYTTFYAQTNAPSVELTATGANHMSFLDSVATCGLVCSFCNTASAPNAQVNAMARAFLVAFAERHVRGLTAYDAYLTGSAAQSRYVATGQATIRSR